MSSSLKRSGMSVFPLSSSKYKSVCLSNVSMFTTLSNELIITIFDYLKPIDILYAFSDLNYRFTCLIYEYKRNVNLCHLLSAEPRIERILDLIRKDVVSLKTDHFIFANGDNLRQQFPSLQDLSISNIDQDFAKELLPVNPSFKYLTTLELRGSNTDLWPNPWADADVDKLPNDFYLSVIHQDSSVKEFLLRGRCLPLSEDTIGKLSPTHNLTKMEVHLTNAHDLFLLFDYIPQIKIFKCQVDDHITKEEQLKRTRTVSRGKTLFLKEFTIINTKFCTNFSMIASFLQDRRSLALLSLNLNLNLDSDKSFNSKHLNGDSLIETLLQYLVHLESFHFCFRTSYNRNSQPDTLPEIISTFQTDFWLKDHEWKVAHYKGCYLFSLPYPYAHFAPTLTKNYLKTTITTAPLAANLFHNVHSVKIEIKETDTDLLALLEYVQRYFQRITNLEIMVNTEAWPPKEITLTSDLANLCLPSVKRFAFVGNCNNLKQLLSVFPNLKDLAINHYYVCDTLRDYLFDNGGDRELLQMKYLRSVTIYNDNTWQGVGSDEDREFQNEFIKHCPTINLRWSSPLSDDEDESDDDEDDKE